MKATGLGFLVMSVLSVGACKASVSVPASVAGSGSSPSAPSAAPAAHPEPKAPTAPKPPPPLVGGQGKPRGIAVDATTVYWTNVGGDHSVMKVAKTGGTPVKLGVPPAPLSPELVTIDDQTVYFSASDENAAIGSPSTKIMKVAKAGGAVAALAENLRNVDVLTSDATHLYWVINGNTVYRMPKTGGAPQALVTGYSMIESLVLDESDLYFAGAKGKSLPVVKAPKTGGAATELVANTNTRALAIDADGIYFLKRAGADLSLHKIAKSGGSPVVLGKVPEPMVMVSTNGTLYGTHRGQSDIWKMPTSGSGGVASTVVAMKPGGYYLAVDDGAVYWTDGVATVNRAPR